jgi:hypothetical protein
MALSSVPRKVEAKSGVAVWNPEGGEEKMQKDRSCCSSTDEACALSCSRRGAEMATSAAPARTRIKWRPRRRSAGRATPRRSPATPAAASTTTPPPPSRRWFTKHSITAVQEVAGTMFHGSRSSRLAPSVPHHSSSPSPIINSVGHLPDRT